MNKENQTLTVNREYKDTMFRLIFWDKKELLNLYNAVNHSHYTDIDKLQEAPSTLPSLSKYRHRILSYFITGHTNNRRDEN